jgi:hypothetical protein
VDDNWDGLKVRSVVQMGVGNAFGIITNDSETLGLDNLEFDLVGGRMELQTGASKVRIEFLSLLYWPCRCFTVRLPRKHR